MTQKELEIIFYLALEVRDNPIVRKLNKEQFAQWVSRWLYNNLRITSCAMGMTYIAPCSEEAYWENQKLEY